MQDLRTTCSVCGKKLDVVELFFNDGRCDQHQAPKQQSRRKGYCDTCGIPVRGKDAHILDGICYCGEHIPRLK
jgi:hypothetical protein